MYAILSSSIIFKPGTYQVERLNIYEAKEWIKNRKPICFSTHETVRVLDVEPATKRLACNYYDEALCVKPKKRLAAFGRQYTKEEILSVGIEIFLIKKIGE